MMASGFDQRTAEWFAARLGKATASKISDIMARTKSGWGASRANYRAQLVAERLTGTPAEGFSNAAMQWGTEQEPAARNAYAFHHDAEVTEIGFVDHPRIDMSGASPDGLVGSIGLVEIKCPTTNTHIETLLGSTVPTKYLCQIQWQLACTEREWCDFVSYDPRLPERMSLFVQRVFRDDNHIRELETEVAAFLAEVDDTVNRLRAEYEREQEKEAA